MPTDHQTLLDFKALLLQLPYWSRGERRLSLAQQALGKDHPAIQATQWDGSPEALAWDLPSACDDYDQPAPSGLSPLCALLDLIREQFGRSSGERGQSIGSLTERLACRAPAQIDWRFPPYPGMLALERHQAPIFFGRSTESHALLSKLDTPQGQRVLLVAGASGSGKSSLVRAGLWATLLDAGRSTLPGSTDWLITAMKPSKPTKDPFLALALGLKEIGVPGLADADDEAAALREDPAGFPRLLQRVLDGAPDQAEWLLILDQLEELFTSVAPELAHCFLAQ